MNQFQELLTKNAKGMNELIRVFYPTLGQPFQRRCYNILFFHYLFHFYEFAPDMLGSVYFVVFTTFAADTEMKPPKGQTKLPPKKA